MDKVSLRRDAREWLARIESYAAGSLGDLEVDSLAKQFARCIDDGYQSGVFATAAAMAAENAALRELLAERGTGGSGVDDSDWRVVVECGRDLIAEVRRLRACASSFETDDDVSDARLAVIANVRFGAPTTRDEETAMALELIRRRGT